MIPPQSFIDQLKRIDEGLFVRWENWKPEAPDNTVPVWPMRGKPFRRKPEEMKTDGRYVVYATSRKRRKPYSVFDVVYSDGSYHPLDTRVLDRLLVRDDVRHNVYDNWEESTKKVQAAENKVGMPREVEGVMSDAYEAFYRENAGLRQYALGQPDRPAAKNNGHYVSIDKRRFNHLVG